MRNTARAAAASILTLLVSQVHAQAYLPVIGGNGGGQFIAPCADKQNLIGFEIRAADDVDAIRPVCAVAFGPAQIGPVALTTDSGLVTQQPSGLVPIQSVAPGWYGGPGGRILRLLCPGPTPILIGIDVAAEGVDTIIVNNIHLFCGKAVTDQSAAANPSAIFDGPGYTPSPGWLGIGIGGDSAHLRTGSQRCPPGQVAVGLHGRSGIWLDAMGLICDAPRLSPAPVASIGRGVPNSLMLHDPFAHAPTPQEICERARQAQARNSPAAPGLEAQCRIATARPPVKSIGRVSTPGSGSQTRPICDVAQEARARNSPAAAGLEAKCRASTSQPQPAPAPMPAQPQAFFPPRLADNSQLWACASTAEAEANGGACNGILASQAFCQLHGLSGLLREQADGTPAIVLANAPQGTPVASANNDVCVADTCPVISELGCAP
jgi:hypothetical protein